MLSHLWKCTPLLPFLTCNPLCIAFDSYLYRLWWCKFVTFFFPLATEEKKSLKRTFQQIQEEEDDDYPGSYSPQDPSAGPLLVCLDPQRVGQSGLKWPLVEDSGHRVAPVTNSMESPEGSSWHWVQDPPNETCQTAGLILSLHALNLGWTCKSTWIWVFSLLEIETIL